MNSFIEYKKYLKKEKRFIIISRFGILIFLLLLWEFSNSLGFSNSFVLSTPSKIINTLVDLHNKNMLYNHIFITTMEIIITFILSSFFGILIASLLWGNKKLYKILDPFLICFNALPKVALGPLFIILFGASYNTIIIMGLMIALITTTIYTYNSFCTTDSSIILLLKSFNANKFQIYYYGVFRSNIKNIIGILKINISLVLIGVIMGELLVSKSGIGYLIMYGSNIFNLDLVMSGIFLLIIISSSFYYLISYISKKVKN